MSRSRGRTGPKPKWGGLSAVSIRWPVAHRKIYEERARDAGMSFSEYIARVVADVHGLEIPEDDQQEEQQQLPLTA